MRHLRSLLRHPLAHALGLLRRSRARALSLLPRLRDPPWLLHRATPVFALVTLALAMGGTWTFSHPAAADPVTRPTRSAPSPSSRPQPSPPPAPAARDTVVLLDPDPTAYRPPKKPVTGKLNLNTASEQQLMLLPSIGPSKAERVITWRKRNGPFKRTADLRRVKGFGYKTFKRLEPHLSTQGDSTLAPLP